MKLGSASKVLVTAATALVAWIGLAGPAEAQTPPTAAPTGKDAPWEITDNSFLVEEAFNQDPKVVQSFFGMTRQPGGDWSATFTQEYPVPGKRHQLSYMIVADSLDSRVGFGDVYLNYRLQATEEGPGRPAFSPRLTAILPSGRHAAGEGNGGLQFNLPFSKQQGDWYFHWNGGATWLPRGNKPDLLTPAIAGSVIYRVRPMINLMLESVIAFQATDDGAGGAARNRASTLSPGIRGGWNLSGDRQVIIGAAVPVTISGGTHSTAVFGYFSLEMPFWK